MRARGHRLRVVATLGALLFSSTFLVMVPAGSAARATDSTIAPAPPVLSQRPMPPRPVLRSSCQDLPQQIAAARRAGHRFATCIDQRAAGTEPSGTATPDATTSGSGPVPPPSNCSTSGPYKLTRTSACAVVNSELDFVDTRSGVITGVLYFGIIDFLYSSNVSTNWEHQLTFDFQYATGDATIAPQSITGRSVCTGSCEVGTVDFPLQTATVGSQAYSQTVNTSTATAPGAIGHGTSTTYFHFEGGNGISTEGSIEALPIRCDNAMPGGSPGPGCIFDQFAPTVHWSTSGTRPQVATHIALALASGLPGGSTSGTYLHRLTDKTLVAKNRSIACGTPPPAPLAPAANSCDEYPFASTYEGAYFSGGGARTYDGCYYQIANQSTGASGYSICSVDNQQNTSAGSDLSGFYIRNRVIDGDYFTVHIGS